MLISSKHPFVMSYYEEVPVGMHDAMRQHANVFPGIDEKMKVGDMYVSNWNFYDDAYTAVYENDVILKHKETMIDAAVDVFQRDIKIDDSWIHIYKQGSSFGRHNHADYKTPNWHRKFVLLHYISRGEGPGGNIELYKPTMTFTPYTGMILIFPAITEHTVSPYEGYASERMVVGMNIEVK